MSPFSSSPHICPLFVSLSLSLILPEVLATAGDQEKLDLQRIFNNSDKEGDRGVVGPFYLGTGEGKSGAQDLHFGGDDKKMHSFAPLGKKQSNISLIFVSK
jgi:hypothetical protein